MEIATAAIGVATVIPQCISSAKKLYDLISRYKDASVLITVIYSESMVLAASLSQLQGLLQQDALKGKPQLYDIIDRALTGCQIVYMCLNEEVRELAQNSENDNLKIGDGVKYPWREDTFKELLQQIRDQQSTLSLLLQGLQMDSISAIEALVEKNSSRLDRISARSKTLCMSRPNINVPQSIFSKGPGDQNLTDTQVILRSAEFDFDDDVVNSVVYRQAMAMGSVQVESEDPSSNVVGEKLNEQKNEMSLEASDITALDLETTPTAEEQHSELLDSLEHSLLPFMPPTSSASDALSPPLPMSPIIPNCDDESLDELPPPLPPRPGRHLETQPEVKSYELTDDNTSALIASSTVSKISATSSPSSSQNNSSPNGNIQQSSHNLTRKGSYDTIFKNISEPEDVRLASSDDVEMHTIWTSLVADEQAFVDRLTKFRTAFYDPVIKGWPVLEKHLELIHMGEQLTIFHRQYLLEVMKGKIAQKSFGTCDPAMFVNWANKTNKLYREYCQRLPHAKGAIRMTYNMDTKFSPFVESLGLDAISFKSGWEDYLELPVSQFDVYIEALRRLIKIALVTSNISARKNEPHLIRALDVVRRHKKLYLRTIEEAQQREDIQSLYRRINTLNADYLSRMDLLQSGRRIICQGTLAMKIHSHGAWRPMHVALLNNYLFWGMLKPPRSQKNLPPKNKREGNIWILEPPIPILEAEMSLPDKDRQFQKATILDDIPRGSVLYPIFIKDKTSTAQPHMLGTSCPKELEHWTYQLQAAISLRAATS